VTATFAVNAPPQASFTISCTALSCTFDGSASLDPEGSSLTYAWDFADAATGSGQTASHTYARAGSYTVRLTVSDNAGATASSSKTFNPISVSARGYKQNGQQKVDLSWNGSSGTSFDVYRDGGRIATVQVNTYTDIGARAAGTYAYKVCAAATALCSNTASVTF
jgi:PKD repeat protein